MAVTRETLRLLGGIRIQVADTVGAVDDDLIRSWAHAWQLVVKDWEAAVADLQTLNDDGSWPSRAQIVRSERALAALDATFHGLIDLGDKAGVTIHAAINPITEAALGHVDVIASQLPKGKQAAELRASLIRADKEQLSAIITRTTEQITKQLAPVAGDAYDTLFRTLVRGVAQGHSPRVVARNMVQGIRVGFNEALTRALVISRTELLDAHRVGAATVHSANSAVVGEWEWISAMARTTCPSCWAQHGTIYPLDVPGPIDHQCGKCSRLPLTKSWADLGFTGIVEPPSLVADAQDTFSKLSAADQLQIMGPKRLDLLKSGDISWEQLSMLRRNPGWRDSMVPTPVRSLTGAS